MTARRHVTSLLHRSRSQQWLRKGHLAFDHCLVQQLAQGLIHPQDVGEAMITLQKLEPSGVAHSCLCVGRKKRRVVGCWLECLRPMVRPPLWLVTLRGDIRFKNVGLSRTGIHEKPSNRAPISRFSSQMTGNL